MQGGEGRYGGCSLSRGFVRMRMRLMICRGQGDREGRYVVVLSSRTIGAVL